jgi:hypothetical protein
MTFASFVALEPRTLLSGTHEEPHPVPPTPKPTGDLVADRAAIMVDVAKMKSDITAGMAVLTAARQARATHNAANDAIVKSLCAELTKDSKTSSSFSATVEAKTKALRTKWAAVIGPEELDVKTNTAGETEEERAADKAKLESDRAAATAAYNAAQAEVKTARASLDAELKADKAAVDDAKKAAAAQVMVDALAISKAEKAVQSVFQSDRVIVYADLATYRSHGGNVDALKLVLPTLNTSDKPVSSAKK